MRYDLFHHAVLVEHYMGPDSSGKDKSRNSKQIDT